MMAEKIKMEINNRMCAIKASKIQLSSSNTVTKHVKYAIAAVSG